MTAARINLNLNWTRNCRRSGAISYCHWRGARKVLVDHRYRLGGHVLRPVAAEMLLVPIWARGSGSMCVRELML